MKLELKHLAPYLPYGLKLQNRAIVHLLTLMGIEESNEGTYLYCANKNIYNVETKSKYYLSSDDTIKPILRPLSDLTKEIEHDGEVLTPSEKYWGFTSFSVFFNYEGWVDLESYLNSKVPYGVVQCLIKWHFDVFGLIEKGLAIDINTLK